MAFINRHADLIRYGLIVLGIAVEVAVHFGREGLKP